MRFPLMTKGVALAAVLLGLVWGLDSVSGVVNERAGRLRAAEHSVAESLGSSQTVVGPVLARQCTETWQQRQGEGAEARTVTANNSFNVYALPRKLVVDGSLASELRYRGIFKVNAYTLNAEVLAEWDDVAGLRATPRHAGGSLACEGPRLVVAVGDSRGIRNAELQVQGQTVALTPGTLLAAHPRGLHAKLAEAALATGADGRNVLRATLRLGLVGTQNLAFAPVADENRVKLASDWPHPSFGGRFLPNSRQVDAKGFAAEWQISALATTARDSFLAGRGSCRSSDPAAQEAAGDASAAPCIESFDVSFVDPVNPYVMSERATKYGLLFIVLTFVSVALVEVMRRLRVHPIQYLLVGSALVVFFLLLVSLSELWPFAWAYATAAAASTAVLTHYGVHVLGGMRPGLVFGGGIATLFGAMFVLLRLEQGSLVLGSVLLFLVLAAVMVVTRKIDWYGLLDQMRSERPQAPAAPNRKLDTVPVNPPTS
jgi:inner membrane protein